MLSDQLVKNIMESKPLTSPEIAQLAVNGIIDYFASSLLASNEIPCHYLLNQIKHEGGNDQVWLIGQSTFATARQAALFNGFQAHLLDYDDVHEQVRGHPSAVILSALFSQITAISSTTNKITGQQFLSAYVIGIEVMALLGIAVGKSHYTKGWHSTATLGGIAATAAICYLLQTSFTSSALAIAATQSAGLRLHFGSHIKPLHAGLAAQQAVQSVELCQYGLLANCDFLNENNGFLAVYGRGNSYLDLSTWGNPWRIKMPGLWFKDYPYCSANAYVADLMKRIVTKHKIKPEHIETIQVTFSEDGDAALIYCLPELQSQGRFSAEYIIACILQNRNLDESCFNSIPVDKPTLSLMQKITRVSLPDHLSITSKKRSVAINIILKDRRHISAEIDDPKGSPNNPYSQKELFAKLTKATQDDKQTAALYHLVNQFNSQMTVTHIMHNIRAQLGM